MSQLTLFTGRHRNEQTARLVDAIVERAKTHEVVCYARDADASKELFAKLLLKVGLSNDTEIPNIRVINAGHVAFFKANGHLDFNDPEVAENESTHPFFAAFDDVPLDRLAWLAEWSAAENVHVLASHGSDTKLDVKCLPQVVELSTYKLLQQLGVIETKALPVIKNVAIGQLFIVVNVEDCALTLNINDPQKSDHVFPAKPKLTPGVKFEVTQLTESTWLLGVAKKQ